ncbi:hypothetical protein LP414_19580 [Polaromonas sp. P1(28)-13]|nr:hypothetical protein LP414_19580 [Polaromonas sp. P1(28)-13]
MNKFKYDLAARWLPVLALCLPFAASADTIYLCNAYAGGTFWTAGTCSSKSAHIERIATVPGGMPFDQQVDIARGQRAEASSSTTTTTVTNPYTNQRQELGTKPVCDGLSSQVNNLDSMARAPQSGQMQDWIRAERKKAHDKQFSLHC